MARGAVQGPAADLAQGRLPAALLQKMNKHGMQQNILVAQGFVTTVIALRYAFIPDVSSAYWIFSVMTTQVYLVMYVLMFVAAMQLRRSSPTPARLPGADPDRARHRGLRGLPFRVVHRVHAAVTVRQRKPCDLIRDRRRGGVLGLGLLVPSLSTGCGSRSGSCPRPRRRSRRAPEHREPPPRRPETQRARHVAASNRGHGGRSSALGLDRAS